MWQHSNLNSDLSKPPHSPAGHGHREPEGPRPLGTVPVAHPMTLTVLLGKAGGLQESDLTLQVQVLLVATEDDYDVGAGQCAGVCQPSSQRIISLPAVEKEKKGGRCRREATQTLSHPPRALTW